MPRPFFLLVCQLLQERYAADTGAGRPTPCYGLGSEADTLEQLQSTMLALLGKKLAKYAPRGGRVLLAGPSLHALLPGCETQGLNVHLLQPGGEKIQSASASITIMEEALLDAELPESLDLVVIEGTVKYLDQLPSLQKVRAALKESGSLVVLAEFLDDDSAIAASELPNLTSFRQLSRRLGYTMESETDLSPGARVTLDRFEADARQWLADGDTKLSDSDIEALFGQLQDIRGEYESGRRALRLFELRFAPQASDSHLDVDYAAIGEFLPGDVATLFEKSFDTGFDAALWQWKYELGRGRCVIARQRQSGEILAHYGGAPRHIHYFGKPALAIQVCDVMALPEVRRQYGQGSLFFKTAATFLEREIGNSVGHLLGFGFPNQKAMNIAKRLKLYEKTDDFVELAFNPEAMQAADLEVEKFDPAADLQALDRLWQAMQAGFAGAIIGVRNADYFNYRYSQHPFYQRGQYKLHKLLDAAGHIQAVTVSKRHAEDWLLMDLICPRASMPAAIAAMTGWIQAETPGAQLKFWLTRGHLDAVNSSAATVNELGIEIPCNSWNPGPAAQLLYGKWWLTAGDMDFM